MYFLYQTLKFFAMYVLYRSVYCDGRGHLSAHLHSYPGHVTLYSCKLKKVVSYNHTAYTCKMHFTMFKSVMSSPVSDSQYQSVYRLSI